jgi:hypothetical protein
MRHPKTTYHGAMFWSYSDEAWLGLFAPIKHDHRWVLRHELTFHRQIPELAALEILKFCARRSIALSSVLIQPSLFPKPEEYGQTVSETFARAHIPVRKGSSDQEAAMSRIRSWLTPMPQLDGTTSPTLIIHPDCEVIIRAMPAVEQHKDHPEDIQVTPEVYPVLALGFFAMSRPMPPTPSVEHLPPGAIGHDVEELRRKAGRR